MAMVYKVLGQTAPNATTETTLYQGSGISYAVISTLIVANRGTILSKFRVSVSVNNAATANKDYIYYDIELRPNDTFAATLGLTLGNLDIIRVYADTSNLSFNLFGMENT